MNLLAVVGGAPKGNSTDRLVDSAIEGARSTAPNCMVKKINLLDHDIQFCKNCLACVKSETKEPIAKCAIRDDMDQIGRDVLDSDRLIFGTPVHMGFATGIMTTFMERICWVFAKPEKNYMVVNGCPMPRSEKKRKSIIIVTSGIIPPRFRRFCDEATPLIKGVAGDSLNSKTVGTLYAGDTWHRGVDFYTDKAFNLGGKLA
ncbi:flavodoxin family protein [Thermodesulfobacteriota bacterium]